MNNQLTSTESLIDVGSMLCRRIAKWPLAEKALKNPSFHSLIQIKKAPGLIFFSCFSLYTDLLHIKLKAACLLFCIGIRMCGRIK